jgi:NAD(P)-dependent dehydrogenase (short-subunit alcohol dehydrogenase family)
VERIDGRTAFVTGAGSGIGLAISEALLTEGASVVLAGRTAATLERECSRLGPRALAQPLDVTDRSSWREARRVVEERFGPVEILVNNAGVGPDLHELADMPVEHFDTLVATMLTGVFSGIHTFGAGMRDGGAGHIVNVSSMVGLIGPARQGAYVATKFGVVGLSEALRAEMEPYGVGVSVVCPGAVRSDLVVGDQTANSKFGRAVDPDVVAGCIIDAIRADELYVITHPEYKSLIAGREARILDAFDRAPRITAPD